MPIFKHYAFAFRRYAVTCSGPATKRAFVAFQRQMGQLGLSWHSKGGEYFEGGVQCRRRFCSCCGMDRARAGSAHAFVWPACRWA